MKINCNFSHLIRHELEPFSTKYELTSAYNLQFKTYR
jgi:hypothetical protein